MTFERTTKGMVLRVDGVIKWFMRQEKNKWFTYFSEDGGRGFRLVPASSTDNTTTWGHETLSDAQKFALTHEQRLKERGDERCGS